MDALLFKSNLREMQFGKDESKKIKRNENKMRCKQARGTSVHHKRKIPENLEYTNGKKEFPYYLKLRKLQRMKI